LKLTFDKILVTGGAGFIGSHTVDSLLFNGVEVWVLDNLLSGSLRNLRQWKGNSRLHFKKGDITRYRTSDNLAKKVDAIVHLAAVVSPLISMQKPELANEVNVSGTLNVLRAAFRNDVQRVVFASSSSVYGDAKTRLILEDAPVNPITPYGASKLAAEKYCRVYHASYDLDTVSLRYFNVYGERQSSNPYSGVIAIFARRLVRGLHPQILGDGRHTRDFIHVSDVARGNLLALQSRKGDGDAFNIGTGVSTTIERLAKILGDLTGRRDVTPVHLKAREGDIRNSCANIAKARRILRFAAEVGLRHGLRSLLNNQYQLNG
jgi:UDP-glucose 4-epimerase